MRLFYKSTIWTEVIFDEDVDKEALIKALEAEDLYLPNLIEELGGQQEMLLETEEILEVEDNEGFRTIELFEDRFQEKLLWRNGE